MAKPNILSQVSSLLSHNKRPSSFEYNPSIHYGYPSKNTPSIEEDEEDEEIEQISDEEYNDRLEKEQQQLKNRIVENHQMVEESSLSRMLLDIQHDADKILALFIADKDFNNLFILTNTNKFLQMVKKMELNIDFTYLYALKQNGSQYYGIDEYTSEITNLFETIGKILKESIAITPKEIRKIKGINIFHNIYLDFDDEE